MILFRSDQEKLKELEEEQEELNGSLLALTSHFAQVRKSALLHVSATKLVELVTSSSLQLTAY